MKSEGAKLQLARTVPVRLDPDLQHSRAALGVRGAEWD